MNGFMKVQSNIGGHKFMNSANYDTYGLWYTLHGNKLRSSFLHQSLPLLNGQVLRTQTPILAIQLTQGVLDEPVVRIPFFDPPAKCYVTSSNMVLDTICLHVTLEKLSQDSGCNHQK